MAIEVLQKWTKEHPAGGAIMLIILGVVLFIFGYQGYWFGGVPLRQGLIYLSEMLGIILYLIGWYGVYKYWRDAKTDWLTWIYLILICVVGLVLAAFGLADTPPQLPPPTETPPPISTIGPAPSTTPKPISEVVIVILTATPTSTPTPTLAPTRDLSLQGECSPQPIPTNMPCLFKLTKYINTPHLAAYSLFGSNAELADKYTGAIHELLRDWRGYFGGTSIGIRIGYEDAVWVIVPDINEVRNIEYYNEYFNEYLNLKYEICTNDGKPPCLYVVSEITSDRGINNYETIASYFSIVSECILEANRVIFTNGKNYPDQVPEIENGLVLIIPRGKEGCV